MDAGVDADPSRMTLGLPDEERFGRGVGLRQLLYGKFRDLLQVDRFEVGISFGADIVSQLAEIQAVLLSAKAGKPKETGSKVDKTSFLGRLLATRGIVYEGADRVIQSALNLLEAQEGVLSRLHGGLVDLLNTRGIKPAEIKVNPGVLWKEFCSYSPQEDLVYKFDITVGIDFLRPDNLADLLYAAAAATLEISADSRKYGQPLGYVERKKGGWAKIHPESGYTNFLLIKEGKGKIVRLNLGESIDGFRKRVSEALSTIGWRNLEQLTNREAMIAFNLDVEDGLYSDNASQALRLDFKRGPFLSLGLNKDAGDRIHLQGAANHLAADGVLMKLLVRGGRTNGGKEYGGMAGFLKWLEQDAIEKRWGNFNCGEIKASQLVESESYDNVAVDRLPLIEGEEKLGADVYTFAVMWVWGVYQQEMKKGDSEWWRMAPDSVACNFTVTDGENSLKPLSSASCWTANPEIFRGSELEKFDEVLPMFLCLCGFKWEKDKTKYTPGEEVPADRLPEAMKLMALVLESKLTDSQKAAILRINRHDWFTASRLIIFPATIIFERSNGFDRLEHTTVAGRDFPNVVINKGEKGTTLIFSVDEASRIMPTDKLGDYAKWAGAGVHELLRIIVDWQNNPASLEDLNLKMKQLRLKLAETCPK